MIRAFPVRYKLLVEGDSIATKRACTRGWRGRTLRADNSIKRLSNGY